MSIALSRWTELSASERIDVLRRPAMAVDNSVRDSVTRIVLDVMQNGDAAVTELTERFDGVKLVCSRVSEEELASSGTLLTEAQKSAISLAIRNVRMFHEAQIPADLSVNTMPGVLCQRISHPIESVGLYVPAGSAPLPSAAIMLAVPATIAGCPEIVLCTPPRPDGNADPAVLYAAQLAGVTDIFKIGGAQAVAAMAYGTQTVPKVDKVFGPGNAWVTEAKSQVASGANGAAIDMPAGPSEVLVIADGLANPEFVAADLLSQAEHGEDSQVILVTDSEALAADVQSELGEQLALLSRRKIAAKSIATSRIIIVDDLTMAVEVSNQYAPEHLILQVESPRNLVPSLRNAGSVFLGAWSPESVGDYCSGTNHVLPTYGHARAYSGLGVDQFIRYMTLQELSEDGLSAIAPAVTELASLEGLDAHSAAVTRRLRSLEDAQ